MSKACVAQERLHPGKGVMFLNCHRWTVSSLQYPLRLNDFYRESASIDSDEIWDVCAYYLAQLCANLVLIASPEHIAIGGGVLNRDCLYPKIRLQLLAILHEYIETEQLTIENIDKFITPSCWYVFLILFLFVPVDCRTCNLSATS